MSPRRAPDDRTHRFGLGLARRVAHPAAALGRRRLLGLGACRLAARGVAHRVARPEAEGALHEPVHLFPPPAPNRPNQRRLLKLPNFRVEGLVLPRGMILLRSALLVALASALAPPLAPVHRRIMLGGVVVVVALPALADDRPPPPQDDEEARIRRKLEAQRAKESRRNFAEDLADERKKERARKNKTKQEQREELCELLGRGC